MSKKDILRRSRFNEDPDEAVHDFISSIEQDRKILDADIWVDRAHVLMLNRQGIVSKADATAILGELDSISSLDWPDLLDGKYDDVHVLIESRIIKNLGEEVGGRLHTARSRNDEVVACVRIALREDLLDIIEGLLDLNRTMLELAGKHVETIMPGYTHLQRAQTTTLAHHLLAHCESIKRDVDRLRSCFDRVNVNPLGAGALSSTSHPVDPALTADLLALDGIAGNSMDAVASRDFLLEAIGDLSISGVGLSRMAEELVLWSTSEFGFIVLSDAYSFTSSIMPQKRNPDVAELSRGRISSVVGDLVSSLSICKGLPLSYHTDLQEATLHLWRATSTMRAVIQVLRGAISTVKVNETAMAEAAGNGFLWATDLADILVAEHGVPFRKAHSIVAELAKNLQDYGNPEEVSRELHEASLKLGTPLESDPETISRAMDARKSVERRIACGGPSPRVSRRSIRNSRRAADRALDWVRGKRENIDSAKSRVRAMQDDLAR